MPSNDSNKQVPERPTVVACAGGSQVAKVANDIAVSLSENRLADMVAASSIGANILPIVQACKTKQRVITIDGCGLHCAKRCLEMKGIQPHESVTLTDLGIVSARDDHVSIMQSVQLVQRVYQALGFAVPATSGDR